MKICSMKLLRTLCLLIVSLGFLSCAQQAYRGPSKGMENVATLIIEQGQADRIEVTVNGQKTDGPPFRITSLPGQTFVQLKYHIRADSDGRVLKRVGQCDLKFEAVKHQLYELRFGLLTPGTQQGASEANFTVKQLNTWPTSAYGSYDKKAMEVCKDLGVEQS